MWLSQKQKKFSSFFLRVSKLVATFNIFKKNMTLIADIFPKFRTLENGLDQCLKSLVSEHISKSKMVNGSKQCWNLNDSTFTIFIDQSQGNQLTESVC